MNDTLKNVTVLKKDGTQEEFDIQKVINAVNKSATRVLVKFTDDEMDKICDNVTQLVAEDMQKTNKNEVEISKLHLMVEVTLNLVNKEVGQAYKDYRNYKQDFVHMLDKVYQESQRIMYIGDKSNANADSTLVSTKRSLIFGELSKELYKKFFLTKDELQAVNDGYIYAHDANARLLTTNCCLADIATILKGGFEMGNIRYTEPKTLDVAFDVIADVAMSMASQQYGGYTIPEVDKILEPYAEKSYQKYIKKYKELGLSQDIAETQALKDVEEEFRQGVQGWEYRFNTVNSSRGDYAFTTCTFSLGSGRFAQMATKAFLEVRKNGQGSEGHKKPVLFPKLIFLYDENLHGEGKPLEGLFNCAIECSKKTMYPDYISLSGNTYIGNVYNAYGEPISSMGCRSFLSPWWISGGLHPANEDDKPVFVGRGNLGVISLNLPMIYLKAKKENKDFYIVLDYYLEMIRQLHIRTYEYLGEMKASINPLGFCEGGFLGGHLKPDDKIKPVLKSFTTSFGITALNELQQAHNHKSLVEDGQFALEVMKYIADKVEQFKQEDGLLHSCYATPSESLSHTQVEQIRKKYGVIENVSDREYLSNGFHCHVSEDITPIEKQDYEERFWDLCKGGQIQYTRFNNNYNTEAFKTIVRRGMQKGFYSGVNLRLSYCEECGHEELEMDKCPKCDSENITCLDRVIGYLGFSRINGGTRMNKGKMAEIADRKSM